MLLDLWAYRFTRVTPPAGGGSGGGVRGRVNEARLPTDETMRKAMLRSRINQDDEELMLLVSTFVRTL